MSDNSKPFAFSQFVPGFDFLRSLAGGATTSAVPGMPSLSSWVAPTLSVEEVDKRIQELKAVQYWLEQNGHALKATIQALEVQKMTLSTLRGMNVRMEDLASAFTRPPAPSPVAAPPAPVFQPEPTAPPPVVAAEKPEPAAARASASGAAAGPAVEGPGVVDALQWWGALTQQFQQIAASALHDAAQLKVPAVAAPSAPRPNGNASGKPASARSSAPRKKAATARRGAAGAAKPAAEASKRAR
jgi:hypothetical protein